MQTDAQILARRAKRTRLNRVFAVACMLAAAMSILILLVLIGTIFKQGWQYLGWDFLTQPPSRSPEKAGMFPAIIGSVMIGLVCALSALPVGVGTAILLQEFVPKNPVLRKMHHILELNITNLAGVPSVVYGLLALTAFVNMFGLFGSALEPQYTVGSRVYDRFFDEAGEAYRTGALASISTEPTRLVEDMTLYHDETGEPVRVSLLEAPGQEAAKGQFLADSEPQRLEDRAWYYLQLPFGRGVLAGGLTLMLVVLPVVIVSAQESLRAVSNTLRQGALALGCTRWQTVWNITLPSALPGIMTGVILAFSRAIGEAAPILIIAGIVYITFTPTHLMDDFTAMPMQIFDWASRPQEDFHKLAASGIIVLLTILLSFNTAAILIRQHFSKRSR